MIEFVGNTEGLVDYLVEIFAKEGFVFLGVEDVFVNDEFWVKFSSHNGNLVITKDVWGFVFILGEKNQQDMLVIDKLLANNLSFQKMEVVFSEYKTNF